MLEKERVLLARIEGDGMIIPIYAMSDHIVDIVQEGVLLGNYFLVDTNIYNFYEEVFSSTIPEERLCKTISAINDKPVEEVAKILAFLKRSGCEKEDRAIVIGGRSSAKVGTFATSIYMRGIEYVYIPTTLLSMLDPQGKAYHSAPYGKNTKNISTKSPTCIYLDFGFLDTSPKHQILDGLAEIIKYGIMLDSEILHFIQQYKDDILLKNIVVIEKLVTKCYNAKRRMFDRGDDVDRLLSFGHTLANAIRSVESSANVPPKYGDNLAAGMYLETLFGEASSLVKEGSANVVKDILANHGFSTDYSIDGGEIVKYFSDRKKETNGRRMRMPMAEEIGLGKVFDRVRTDSLIDFLKKLDANRVYFG